MLIDSASESEEPRVTLVPSELEVESELDDIACVLAGCASNAKCKFNSHYHGFIYIPFPVGMRCAVTHGSKANHPELGNRKKTTPTPRHWTCDL